MKGQKMIAVDPETKDRLDKLADGVPMAKYLRHLSLNLGPMDTLESRLVRIEKKIALLLPPDDKEEVDISWMTPDIKKTLTLTDEMKAMIPKIYAQFGVSSMLEVLDIIKYHRENGSEADKLESERVYKVFGVIFDEPGLSYHELDEVLRYTFRVVEKLNNPDEPKGEG